MSLFSFVAAFCLLQVIAGGKLDLKCKCDDSYTLRQDTTRDIGTVCIDGECGIDATRHAAAIQSCTDGGNTVEDCENAWDPVCSSFKGDAGVMQACTTKSGLITGNTERRCFTEDGWDMFYCTTDNCNTPYDEACAETKK